MKVFERVFASSIFRYIGVGGTAFLIDFLITVICRDLLGIPLWLAVAAGYWSGFVINFSLQRSVAFDSREHPVCSLVLYGLLVAFNWAATTAVMYLLVTVGGLTTPVGKILCTVMTTVWNYPIYRFIVFPNKSDRLRAPSCALPESVDFVIPAHNCAHVLSRTVEDLGAWGKISGTRVRVLLVENGSSDETPALVTRLAQTTGDEGIDVCALSSRKGLGHAYREGIAASTASLVVLSADDLPFGTSDIDAWWRQPTAPIAIGSKAHPDSQVERGVSRAVASAGFRILRRAVMGSRVGDPQGTLLLSGNWIRSLSAHLEENGWLASTEIVAYAEATGVPIVELPVVLTGRQAEHATRIRLADVWRMGVGLLRLRRRVTNRRVSLSTWTEERDTTE